MEKEKDKKQLRKENMEKIIYFTTSILDNNEHLVKWQDIMWVETPKQAKKLAIAQNKPIFLEVVVDCGDQEKVCWIGGRILRCSVLSDPRIIERINKDMIPISINATHKGFPTEEFAAVKPMKALYKTSDHWKKGYASISILDPIGKNNLGGIALLTPRISDVLTYEGFTALVEKSYIRWNKIKKMDEDFKKGNIFSGIGGVLGITKEEFGKAVDGFSDCVELGEQLRAYDVKEDHFKELKSHGVRRSEYKEGFPNISSITPRILENGAIINPVNNTVSPIIIPNQSAPNIPTINLKFQQGSSAPQLYPEPRSNYNYQQVNTYIPYQIPQPIYQIKLPTGWETKIDARSGRIYYVDHNTRTTHWNPPPM